MTFLVAFCALAAFFWAAEAADAAGFFVVLFTVFFVSLAALQQRIIQLRSGLKSLTRIHLQGLLRLIS